MKTKGEGTTNADIPATLSNEEVNYSEVFKHCRGTNLNASEMFATIPATLTGVSSKNDLVYSDNSSSMYNPKSSKEKEYEETLAELREIIKGQKETIEILEAKLKERS